MMLNFIKANVEENLQQSFQYMKLIGILVYFAQSYFLLFYVRDKTEDYWWPEHGCHKCGNVLSLAVSI